jgi:putative membrane protein
MSLLESPDLYLWLKAFHVIAVIAWMAGMLYLPRLFVYHCETAPGSAESERFKLMERKLLRVIVNPSMIAVWLVGIALALLSHAYAERWLQLKFVLVLGMSGLHGMFSRWVKDFARDANTRTQRFYRIVNELPTLLLVAIVILAVVKPF